MKHLDYLDGWRGVAILMVLGGHFFGWSASRLGVEVFFVLSGLLMSRLLFEERSPLRTFYRRRIARIFPAFFLYLTAVAVLAAWESSSFPAGQFLFNALFVQRYAPASIVIDPALPLGHLWSLNVEEHAYVLLSFIALCARDPRAARWWLTVVSAGCVSLYVLRDGTMDESIFRTEYAAFPLLASAALRLWWLDLSAGGARAWFGVGAMGLVATVLCSRLLGHPPVIDYVLKPLTLAVMVNTLHAAPALVTRLLAMKWLCWFGVCSFSIYLWQQPFYHLVHGHKMSPLVGLALSTAIGTASCYGVERPLRRLIRDGWPRGKPAAASLMRPGRLP